MLRASAKILGRGGTNVAGRLACYGPRRAVKCRSGYADEENDLAAPSRRSTNARDGSSHAADADASRHRECIGGSYGFRYNEVWSVVPGCLAGDRTLAVFIVADACGIYHVFDDITVNGKTLSRAGDNSNGSNDPAGPLPTLDPSLLPPVILLPPPQ